MSSVVSQGILVWIFAVRFFFLWSTKEIIALSLTNRTWLLSPHTPESWCKSWAVPSACINLIRKTPFQSWSLEDAHWGRFCREVAQWKHFLQHWVPKEIGWRLHLCYNKKEYFFLGGTFSDCSNCHWQWAVLGTWVLQCLTGVLKHPLAHETSGFCGWAMACKSTWDRKKRPARLPTLPFERICHSLELGLHC